jgi:hypothetical protein
VSKDFIRLQQLAGIQLTKEQHLALYEDESSDEQELDSLDSEIASAFGSGLSSLQGQTDVIKEEIDEAEVEMNEVAVTSLLISVLLSTPKLLEIIGGIVKKVASIFSKEKGKVKAGDGFIHAGHALEGKYLKILKLIIKTTGLGKKAGLKTPEDYDQAAKLLLYSILGVAAISAGFASAEAIGGALAGKGVTAAIYGTAKGGLAGLKSHEVIDGMNKLINKIK